MGIPGVVPLSQLPTAKRRAGQDPQRWAWVDHVLNFETRTMTLNQNKSRQAEQGASVRRRPSWSWAGSRLGDSLVVGWCRSRPADDLFSWGVPA